MILLGVVGILVTILAASKGASAAPVSMPQVETAKTSLSPDLQKALAKAGGPVENTQTKFAGDGYKPPETPKESAVTFVPPTVGGASGRSGGNVNPTLIAVPAFQLKKGLL